MNSVDTGPEVFSVDMGKLAEGESPDTMFPFVKHNKTKEKKDKLINPTQLCGNKL